MGMKYNLTFWQRIKLIPLWFMWFFHAEPEKRKSWHHVKKSMEKHEHKYTKYHPVLHRGRRFDFWDCEHEGCTFTNPDKS